MQKYCLGLFEFCELPGDGGGRIPICGQSMTSILICEFSS